MYTNRLTFLLATEERATTTKEDGGRLTSTLNAQRGGKKGAKIEDHSLVFLTSQQ